jgi:hypothetical protein
MRFRGLVSAVVLAVVATAGAAQNPTALPPPLPNPADKFGSPPGSADYLGPSFTQPFEPKSMFPQNLPPPRELPAPEIPSVLPPGEGADGGLLPPRPPPRLWAGTIEAGLNGANGNTDVFNFRSGWNARRKTDTNLFTTDFVYMYAKQDGEVRQQAALFNARDEILFPGHPWSIFFATQVEYDQLRDYKFRAGQYFGTGYKVIDDKSALLRLRVGAGATREFAGPGDDRWVAEGVFGYDVRYRFDERNAIVSVLDYYPRIDDWGQFRVRARAAYEVVIDPKTGTVLRLGVQDRYDSNPGTSKRNDVNYFMTFGMNF